MFLFNLDNRDKNTKNYQLKVKDIYLAYNSFVNAPTCTHMGGKNFNLARLDWSRRKGCLNACSQGTKSIARFTRVCVLVRDCSKCFVFKFVFSFSLERSVPAGTPSNMAVFQPNGKHVLRSLKPCDLSSCTKRLEHFLALRKLNYIAAMCSSHLVIRSVVKRKLTLSLLFQ